LVGYRLDNVPNWHDAVKGVREVIYNRAELPLDVRYEAAVAYGMTGDDHLAYFDSTWAWLEGGQFLMGAQSNDPARPNYDLDAAPWESPVRLVTVRPFAIRKYPITVQEYLAFIEDGGYKQQGDRWWSPEGLDWRTQSKVETPLEWDDQTLIPNAPVTGVCWFECSAYCRWLADRTEEDAGYRLPYEHEWEYAARRGIPAGKQFRWGSRMQIGDYAEANWAGCDLRRKSPVGLFPQSTTPDGVADLFGNVEEWCLDVWADGEEEVKTTVPGHSRIPRAVIERSAGGWSGQGIKRIVRGGSCIRFSRLCRPSYRSRILENRRYLTVGFRPIRPEGQGSNG